MTTQDLVEFKANLKALFPNCFNRNGELDFEALKRVLIEAQVFAKVQEAQESKSDLSDSSDSTKDLLNAFNEFVKGSHYKFDFIGKNFAKTLYNLPPQGYIMPLKKADSSNAIIIGDNLSVLKHLKNAYRGAIKAIYIDPPYNTQSDGFIYNDSKNFTKENLSEALNISPESANAILERTPKGKSNHSAWLCFMYPRLALAKDLLRDDGVIFISIDDNEQANLKLLCDEVFGEGNFIETFLWNKTQTPPSASHKTRKTHEYILCYQKSKDNQKMIARFSDGGDAPLWNETNSERILTFPANYVFSNLKDGIYQKGVRDKIELLDNVEIKNGKILNSFRLKGHFRWKQETLEQEVNENVFLVVKSDKFSIRYCREGERIVMPTNEISKKDGVGTNETASSELEKLMGAKIFSFNKPISLVKYLISLVSRCDSREREREQSCA